MKNLSVRTIVAIGISSAIFLVLAKFVVIPTPIPNTSIQVTYAFLGMVAVIFGPIAGVLTGFIGHTLNDITSGYGAWWSWIIASAVVGLVIGFAKDRIDIDNKAFGKKEIITFNIFQAIANAIAWFAVAPLLDVLIYAEPFDKVIAQGVLAGLSNIICTGVFGTLLLLAYSKTRIKPGSLKHER